MKINWKDFILIILASLFLHFIYYLVLFSPAEINIWFFSLLIFVPLLFLLLLGYYFWKNKQDIIETSLISLILGILSALMSFGMMFFFYLISYSGGLSSAILMVGTFGLFGGSLIVTFYSITALILGVILNFVFNEVIRK